MGTQLAARIEDRARMIAKISTLDQWEASPRGQIARALALALEDLERLRALHKDLVASVSESECHIGTQLMQPTAPNEQMTLKLHLLSLKSERRRLELQKHEQVNSIRYKLLDLINKHAHITLADED